MHNYQEAFLAFALEQQVIRFGNFTLKSGRQSPYFFNAGLFNTGKAMSKLGQFYANALITSGIDFDMLFGPAYKGIPMVTATAIALSERHGRDIPWCYNRKEVKDHGEGGMMVGATLEGKAIIIDDVITAGTAVREVMQIMEDSAAKPAAVMIAMDRQEKGSGELSTLEEIERDFGIPVISIVKQEHLFEYVKDSAEFNQFGPAIAAYREQFGS
ncbi:orotate phosphoribosyltransferase [Candidatus Sororendozoicomonas aggregata]|uniref:orotate phosphoribosyltransferase n=1 Tax=Candidatus Sororendozoicomonas aggregata TaxID=3073239 RepID=UPI002ED32A81